jgi:hypothetical protein
MRREVFQWFGLLGAPLAWTGQLLLGFGFVEGSCNSSGDLWGIAPSTWEIAVTAAAVAVALAAEGAALAVWRETSRIEGDGPPVGRVRFFAAGSLVVGVVFLGVILMSGLGATHLAGCRQG